jgi:hypothetical protein
MLIALSCFVSQPINNRSDENEITWMPRGSEEAFFAPKNAPRLASLESSLLGQANKTKQTRAA